MENLKASVNAENASDEELVGIRVGAAVKIEFLGEVFKVKKIKSRASNIIRFRILGEKHGFTGDNIAFNTDRYIDAELVK